MVLNNAGPRYYITRVLKAGGQGAVYETVGDDGKVYAVKEMLDRFTDAKERAEAIARFEHEANMLEQLSHPRIPRVYAHFQDEGRHYLAMDFVRGEDLEDIAEREGAIAQAQVLEWADQITDVLGYLHDKGLIYRDMKPSNVMIDKQNGGIKVVDFGIAKVLQPAVRGTQIGTPGYAPPEQYQGLAGRSSDVFALGATLHHLLTGRDPTSQPPFTFPRVRDLQPQVSQRVCDAISHALQMKPEDRFQSMDEFRVALGFAPRQVSARLFQTAPAPATPQPAIAPTIPIPAPVSAPAVPVAPQPAAPAPQPAAPAPRPAAPAPQPRPAAPAPQPAAASAPRPAAAAPQPAAAPAPQPAAPAPPVAAPPQASRGSRVGLVFAALLLLILLLGGAVFALFGGDIPGLSTGPVATPQTFVQQPFRADNLEIIITVPDVTDELLSAGFLEAFEQRAQSELGAGVQVVPRSLAYISPPEAVGPVPQGVQYRASVQGDVLVPQP